MIGRSPQCYIPSFVEIGLSVTEKKNFEGFLPYVYGRAGHLGHVTSIMSSEFHFLVSESFHTKFGSDRHSSFLRKSVLNFLYVYDLGPRSRNDLDLQYSHIFINSIRCLLLLIIRSLAAIVSEKSTVFTFSYKKA